MSEVPLCRICNQDEEWHRRQKPQHAFSTDGQLRRSEPEVPQAAMPHTTIPSDPILRLVLIEKGIVTMEELEQAEQKLRLTGVLVARPAPESARVESPPAPLARPKKIKGMDGKRR